jgi:hypothetical protein
MDSTVRTALIAVGGVIGSAILSSFTSILVSSNELKAKTKEVESLNKQAQATLNQTANLMRYVYDNGTLTSTAFTGGKMVVRVNGTANAGPAYAPINMTQFEELCGDEDGCSLTLGATRFHEEKNPNYMVNAPLQGAPCRFFLNRATRAWTLSEYCTALYGNYVYSSDRSHYEFTSAPYQIYTYSNSYGIDDSGGKGSDLDGQPLVILGFKGACYLAESAPDINRGGGHFLPDDPAQPSTGKGLYLIASSPTWDYPGVYPATWPADDPQRRCELIVED